MSANCAWFAVLIHQLTHRTEVEDHMRHCFMILLLLVSAVWMSPALSADKTRILLGTATPGGGFELFGGHVAAVINEVEPTLLVVPVNTKGSRENIPLLEQGKLDLGLVASLPAYEAVAGIGREPTDLKIVTAIYSTFGLFAVRGDSPYQTFDDLLGKPVAWGTKSSGLTLLARYVTDALGLDRDKDFQANYLQRAGLGAPMVLEGQVEAQWGGGIGWPNFTKIMNSGGKLVGLTPDQVAEVNAKYNFLKPYTLPAGSYPGQTTTVYSVASFSFMLARPGLDNDITYKLARALHKGQAKLAERVAQGRETLPENTIKAADKPDRIHSGVQRYLREIDLQ
jgi:TRAP transporter TAXI family solute receptor